MVVGTNGAVGGEKWRAKLALLPYPFGLDYIILSSYSLNSSVIAMSRSIGELLLHRFDPVWYATTVLFD